MTEPGPDSVGCEIHLNFEAVECWVESGLETNGVDTIQKGLADADDFVFLVGHPARKQELVLLADFVHFDLPPQESLLLLKADHVIREVQFERFMQLASLPRHTRSPNRACRPGRSMGKFFASHFAQFYKQFQA